MATDLAKVLDQVSREKGVEREILIRTLEEAVRPADDRMTPQGKQQAALQGGGQAAGQCALGLGEGDQKRADVMQHQVLPPVYPEHVLRQIVEVGLQRQVREAQTSEERRCAPDANAVPRHPDIPILAPVPTFPRSARVAKSDPSWPISRA